MHLRLQLAVPVALCAFAANSLLCRLALRSDEIDPLSFTALRLASGALLLTLLGASRGLRLSEPSSWRSAGALLLYAAPFSFAYVELNTGTGALILFGSVQLTMVGWGVGRGERPRLGFWLGMPVALAGLAGLTLPGLSAPTLRGALLMICAGIAWGAYSLLGRTASVPPLQATGRSFVCASGLSLVVLGLGALFSRPHASPFGAALACASGALASGLGYAVWYFALRSLSASRAAMLQLAVPVLAAVAGVLWLGEALSLRLVLSGAAILLGIVLERQHALFARPDAATRQEPK